MAQPSFAFRLAGTPSSPSVFAADFIAAGFTPAAVRLCGRPAQVGEPLL